MRGSNSPMILWNYAIERRALICNAFPRPIFQAQGKKPHECTVGNQMTFLMFLILASTDR